MPDLFLNDQYYGTLTEEELKIFLRECDAKDLKYIRMDDLSWQILPPLLDFTVLIKCLNRHILLDNATENLKNRLYRQGGTVITDKTPGLRSDLQDIVDAQIYINVIEYVHPSDLCLLKLYYSLNSREKSMALAGAFLKEIDKVSGRLTYTVASYWRHLFNMKYYDALHAAIPSVVIEFSNPEALSDSWQDIITNMFESLVCLYGKKINSIAVEKIRDCWNIALRSSIKATLETTDSISSPQQVPVLPTGQEYDQSKPGSVFLSVSTPAPDSTSTAISAPASGPAADLESTADLESAPAPTPDPESIPEPTPTPAPAPASEPEPAPEPAPAPTPAPAPARAPAAPSSQPKAGLTSALARKKKTLPNKPTFLSTPEDEPVNYFVRPSNMLSPVSSENRLPKNLTPPIVRSTFQKSASTLESKTSADKLPIPYKIPDCSSRDKKTLIENLKTLDQIVNNPKVEIEE